MNIAQAVVAGMAAAELEPGLPGGNIELIMGYQDGCGLNFVKPGQASHRAAAQVHEGLGFKQPQGLAVDGGAGHQCLVVFVNHPVGFDLPCDRIGPPKTGVVPGLFVFWAGVAQAHHHADHGPDYQANTWLSSSAAHAEWAA